jgi:broad specificity phosphatase PhoE
LKLILIRHGETHWNEKKLIQGGRQDIELSSAGIRQASKLAVHLKNEKFSIIITSPMKRAVATAKAIASLHGLPLEVDDRLKEIDVAALEGMSLDDLNISFTRFLKQWQKDREASDLPYGEKLQELQNRAWEVVQILLEVHPKETVILVSHYFVIMAIILQALDLPLSAIVKFKLDTCGISVLSFANHGARLLSFNNTCY